MKTLDLLQGSPEWHQHRATYFNASDAPAMMDVSPYKTRDQLLRERASGLIPEVDDQTQQRFDDGHRFEALARPLAEEIIGEELYPVVGIEAVYSASFDGLTIDEEISFEHKTLNESLRHIKTGSELPEHYRIQIEQQLMVSGAKKCLFMATRWDGGNLVESMEVWYEPDRELRKRIVAGWKQFEKDRAKYVPAEIIEKPTAEISIELPALFVHAKGEITTSNMAEYGIALADRLQQVRAITLTTDQDFSNAEAAAKLFREQCQKLKLAKEAMLEQTVTIGEAARMIDAWHEDLRVTALKLEKDVEKEKESRKYAIIMAARNAYAAHIDALEESIRPIRLGLPNPDFAGAMKGKKLFSAMQNAVDTCLSQGKSDASVAAQDMVVKQKWCKQSAEGYGFLFLDLQQIVTKPLDDFQLLITTRIEKHKAEEAAKLEAERARIQQEEEAKARAKVEEEIAQDAAAFAQCTQQQHPVSENIAQTKAHGFSKSTIMAMKTRPSDDELIDALMRHFRASESLVIEWLLDMDLNAAAGRLAEELT